mgnify:CR=1 FL=1
MLQKIYPRSKDKETVYLKSVITNPNIIVGDYTMYNDFVKEPKDFEKNKGLVSTDYFAFPYGVSCQNAQDYLKSSSVKLAFSYNQNRHMTCNDKQYLLPRYLMFSNMPFPLFKWWIE